MNERIRWIDPTLPGPWEIVYFDGPEGWTVLAPWTGEGSQQLRPHVAECGGVRSDAAARATAERIVAWGAARTGDAEAESRAVDAVARAALLEGHVRALVAWMDDFRDYLDMAAMRFPVEAERSERAGATWDAARAALAPCESCRGRGCTEGRTRHAADDHDPCPTCGGRDPAARVKAALADLWDGGYGESPEDAEDDVSVEQKRHDIDAALARLAAAVPPPDAREAEALLACRRAVEAREKYEAAPMPRGKLCEAAGEAHDAAVAALKKLEEEK